MNSYKICAECSFFLPIHEEIYFCPECGAKLIQKCGCCGSKISYPYAKFCGNCGKPFNKESTDNKS